MLNGTTGITKRRGGGMKELERVDMFVALTPELLNSFIDAINELQKKVEKLEQTIIEGE